MKHGAERTPADRTASVKRRRLSSTKHSLEPGRVPVLADLPETVLLQVFKRLGLDRLTAQQGARRAPATSALQSACHKQTRSHERPQRCCVCCRSCPQLRAQPRCPPQCSSLASTLASCEAVWTLAASVPALAAGCGSAMLHAQGQARARARRHHGSRRPRQARRHGHHCPGLLHGARRQPGLHEYAALLQRLCAWPSARRSVPVKVCAVSRRSALARPRCAHETRGASATGRAASALARPLCSRAVLAAPAEGVNAPGARGAGDAADRQAAAAGGPAGAGPVGPRAPRRRAADGAAAGCDVQRAVRPPPCCPRAPARLATRGGCSARQRPGQPGCQAGAADRRPARSLLRRARAAQRRRQPGPRRPARAADASAPRGRAPARHFVDTLKHHAHGGMALRVCLEGLTADAWRAWRLTCGGVRRVCLEGLTLRTVQSTGDRSVVSFGPACNYIRLERCEIGGFCGLILPLTKQARAPAARPAPWPAPAAAAAAAVRRARRRSPGPRGSLGRSCLPDLGSGRPL